MAPVTLYSFLFYIHLDFTNKIEVYVCNVYAYVCHFNLLYYFSHVNNFDLHDLLLLLLIVNYYCYSLHFGSMFSI